MISTTGTIGAGQVVGARRSLQQTAVAMLREAARVMWTSAERRRQRHGLAALDDHFLRDIGLTRGDILTEVSKPFWRA